MGYVFILFYIMPCWINITKSEGSGEHINGICLCIFRRKEIMHRYLNKIRLFNKKSKSQSYSGKLTILKKNNLLIRQVRN